MQQTQSPENIFKQKIMNLSYDYLRTTYPNLMPYGITLKLDNYDIIPEYWKQAPPTVN